MNKLEMTDSEKILLGLKIAYEKMLEEKRKNNLEIAIWKDGKVVLIKP